MSKKKDTKEEETNSVEEVSQTQDNQEVVEETVKEEPTPEELIKVEKDKFLRLFAEFENYKKRTTKNE